MVAVAEGMNERREEGRGGKGMKEGTRKEEKEKIENKKNGARPCFIFRVRTGLCVYRCVPGSGDPVLCFLVFSQRDRETF